MKTKLFSAVVLISFLTCFVFAGTGVIQWFHQQPKATTINDSAMMVLENPTSNGYSFVLLSEMKGYMAGPGNTNFFTTNLFSYYTFTTNITVISNAYFFQTNFAYYTITTNLTVVSNAYFYQTNFVNYEYVTNLYSSNIYTTNLFSTNIWTTNLFADYSYLTNIYVSNAFFTNLYTSNAFITNLYVTNAYITNLYVSNAFITNITIQGLFLPTNAVNTGIFSTKGGGYETNMSGDVVLGQFDDVPADKVWSIFVLATNSTAANHTLTFPNGTIGSGYGRPAVFTVTNATMTCFQVIGFGQKYTNIAERPFYQ